MWRNLLPQGTRTVELCSAYALIFSGILMLTGVIPIVKELLILDTNATWGLLIIIFGIMQVYAILEEPRLEVLRTLLSWVAGCFWLWIGVICPDRSFSAEDIATIFLGVGNLYGFIINFNLIQVSWTD